MLDALLMSHCCGHLLGHFCGWESLKNPQSTAGCSAGQRRSIGRGRLCPELPSAEPLQSGQRLGLEGQPCTRVDLPSPALATVLVRGWPVPPEPVETSEGRASGPTSEEASGPHVPLSKPLTGQRGAGLLSLGPHSSEASSAGCGGGSSRSLGDSSVVWG